MDMPNDVLVGHDPAIQSLLNAARLVAATDVAALLLGESGTGKELLARAIHADSRRADKPFVSINCAALPEQLAESELFGHRKGAFTGADRDYPGRIGATDGGTLFLDEIGELSPAVQAKLLRFLECGECQGVGDVTARRVDVRIIAATHRDLYAMVERGQFRQDLYYRLNVVPLELPPLRKRPGDIALLTEHLLSQLAARYGLERPYFTPAASATLKRYSWPGNVRELRNLCERMLVLLPGQRIDVENLPPEIRLPAPVPAAQPSTAQFALPESGIHLEEFEKGLIAQALAKSQGNRSKAARLLGLTRDTLLYRIKKYAIEA